MDREAPRLSPPRGDRLRRIRPRGHVASRRRARLARAAAADREIRPHLPVRAGRIRRLLPALDDGRAHAHDAQVRRPGAGGALPARAHAAGPRCAHAGRDVHDRAGRGVGRRGDGDARGARRRCLAPLRRQVVLLERGRGPRAGARAARRRSRRDEGPVALPLAEGVAGRLIQPHPHRAPEGQARHARHAERRDPPGRRHRATSWATRSAASCR